MKQKWCLSRENSKPKPFALILSPLPPTSITDKLPLFLLRYWLDLPFLFFPLLLLSSWAFCGDAPARRGEPTLDPVIAHRSWRIASLPVGRGHRNGLKWQRERERGRGRGRWGCCCKMIHFSRLSVAEQRWRATSGGDAWGGSGLTEVGDVGRGRQRQMHAFLMEWN